MNSRTSRRSTPSAKQARLESGVEQLGEVLKIVSSRAPDDHAAVACFLLNRTGRLDGKSPMQVFCRGTPKMRAKVKELAIESLE